MDYFLFAAGLGLLLWSADRLVDATTGLARRLGISALTTAVVVVGFGTSMPELLTSVDAALQGSPALAIANVVGSNIANVLLVLGLSALCLPLACDPAPMRRDLLSLMLASVVALCVLQLGAVERWMGLVLATGMVAYLALLLASSRGAQLATGATTGNGQERIPSQLPPSAPGIATGVLRSLLAILLLLAGAHLLVSGALGIAHRHDVSESLIGLTLVALGTSLPELAIAVLALMRRNAEVAIGNVIGSCLFNILGILGILGITALVSPLEVPEAIARFDIWIMLAAALALTLFVRTGWRVNRAEGAVLLLGYPLYLGVLVA